MAKENYRLLKRDIKVFEEINRWRFCLARHIMVFADFPSMRTCDRRIAKLIEMGYLNKQKILYGIPHLYTVTAKTKGVSSVPYYRHKIHVEHIHHDICVLDAVVYFKNKFRLSMEQIRSEKELHSIDGFSNRIHKPDFAFIAGTKKYCVELELSAKSKERLEANIKANHFNYDGQFWIVPEKPSIIKKNIQAMDNLYTNIDIIDWQVIAYTK